jgi:hypothetical protein
MITGLIFLLVIVLVLLGILGAPTPVEPVSVRVPSQDKHWARTWWWEAISASQAAYSSQRRIEKEGQR